MERLIILAAFPFPAGPQPPRLPALETLYARAGRCPAGEDLAAVLAGIMGLDADAGPLPHAAVARQGEDEPPAHEGYWLRADPVHLIADRDRVYFGGSRHLQVRPEEVDHIRSEFNRTFSGDGLRLETPAPERWYLQVDTEPDLHTHPPHRVAGRDVYDYLPAGPDSAAWRTVLTEIQMLLHASEVNRLREERGETPINSLWFWGGGRLPDPGRPQAERIIGNGPLTRGLAALTGAPLSSGFPGTETGRAVVPLGETFEEPPLDLSGLERDWIAPALDAIRKGELERLELWLDGTWLCAGRRELGRWWRRRRPLPGPKGETG